MKQVDLNADIGEGTGADEALLDVISSASIACGGHAGDAATMQHVLALCRQKGVRVGAHPGFVDKENFGRKRLDLPMPALNRQITEQIETLRAFAAEAGIRLAYVKLHGAMANMAAENFDFARELFSAVRSIDASLAILALDGSRQVDAALDLGLDVITEAYADRAYAANGQLVSRSQPRAVIHDVDEVVARCLRLAKAREIAAIDGTVLASRAASICVHGDTPGAVAMAGRIRSELEQAGIAVGSATAQLP